MIRGRRYTTEMLQFIAQTYQQVGVADVAAAFNAKFGTNKTPKQIKAAISNHKITCGRITGQILKGKFVNFTQQQADFIASGYQEYTIAALTAELNKEFKTTFTEKQIRSFTRNHAIKSGRTGQFEKGINPWNKDLKGWVAGGRSAETRFKKGITPHGIRQVGDTRICSKGGHWVIKTKMPRTWRDRHVVEWEKVNGKVPAGHSLWFKDNDVTNFHPSNMMLITKAQRVVINKLGMGKAPAEYKQAAVILADITMKRTQLIRATENA